MLDRLQIREMLEAGISFGAHTWTHPSVSQLSSEALDQELGETKSFLELALGHRNCPFRLSVWQTRGLLTAGGGGAI